MTDDSPTTSTRTRKGELFVGLSVNFSDNPKIIDAGPLAELVYVRAMQIAKRTMSDGFISSGQVRRMTVDLDDLPGFPAEDLEREGLWERVDGGWLISGWLDRNLSRETIQGDAAKNGARGNHDRWHVARGIKKEGCEFCYPDLAPESPPESAESPRVAPDSPSESPPRSPIIAIDIALDGDIAEAEGDSDPVDNFDPEAVMAAAAEIAAQRECERRIAKGDDIGNPSGYAKRRRAAILSDNRREWSAKGVTKTTTPEALADLVEPVKAPAPPHPTEATLAASLQRMAAYEPEEVERSAPPENWRDMARPKHLASVPDGAPA